MKASPDLETVAGAILDGTPIDWNGISLTAMSADAALIAQLKTLDALCQASRGGGPSSDAVVSWGHLRVIEEIGRGAFGVVYRAWDTRLDREVALKLLASSVESNPPESQVIEEGRLLARIRHPNVVTIYGAERIDNRVGLWMEFVKGRTLEQMLAAGSTFSSRDVMQIGEELCHAVAAVHAAGLLHRDVKAQNVMIGESGRLVLMDFGAGRDRDGVPGSDVTGTPLYLAPEVLAGMPATAQSDVYSIGVLLYHLLTGTYPVRGRDLDDLRRAHAARTHQLFPSSVRVQPSLRRAIARALEPDPGRRFQSAGVFAETLGALRRARSAFVRRSMVAAAGLAIVLAATAWVQRDRLFGNRPASAAAAPPVIAVMPFENLTGESDSNDFVDGLTLEVGRDLSMIDGLQVRSQTSSLAFKKQPRDLAAIGRQLGVALIVDAKVLRARDRLRISVQLVRVADDIALWSDVFDSPISDVLTVQDRIQTEISRAIVDRLRVTLNEGQRRYRTSGPAYDAYLRARAVLNRRGNDNAKRALNLFQQVIDQDKEFAPAYAGVADAYAEWSWQLTGLKSAEGLKGMRPAATRAIELDPLLGEAHAAMGIVHARELDWTAATQSFEKALTYSPRLPQILLNYAEAVLMPTGQLEKAARLLKEALALDPHSPTALEEFGWVLLDQRKFSEAAASFRLALAADPGLPFATQGLARSLTFAGHPEDAIDVWRTKPASDGDWERWLFTAYVRAGRHADTDRLIAAHRTEHPYRQALIFAALNDKDRTFAALNQAVDLTPQRTASLLLNPEMALLDGDPRLDALRRRLNLGR